MSGSHAEIRGGGTDLSERRRSGVAHGDILDLEPTTEMTEIAWDQMGRARIGALVTIATIAVDARLRQASGPGCRSRRPRDATDSHRRHARWQLGAAHTLLVP
jgi:xanthine dehydrogenase YagS FAD-binding subunit